MTLRAVPGGEASDIPPWERDDFSYAASGGRKEDSYEQPVSCRITARQYRNLQKIVQHRKYGQLETMSDVVRVALSWIEWAAGHGRMPELKESVDLQQWEQTVGFRRNQRQRVKALLDDLAEEIAEATEKKNVDTLKEIEAELGQMRDRLHDEFRTRANKMWLLLKETIIGLEK